jgi:hypothetical protein
MDNLVQRKVSPAQYAARISSNQYFRQGYDDYVKQRDYNYSIEDKLDAILYARGRAFAIFSIKNRAPRAVWRKGVLAKTAQERLVRAAMTGWVL